MNFSPGQKVTFLEENGRGTIVKVLNNHSYLVEDENGLDRVFYGDELMDAQSGERGIGSAKKTKNSIKGKAAKVSVDKPMPSIPFRVKNGVAELDLHMENLRDSDTLPAGISFIEFQLSAAKELIQYCTQHKIAKLILIHGKGQGILRNELKKTLTALSNVEFWDAQGKQHQFGAFEVRLRGLYS